MRTRSVTPVLALALLASLTACSASPSRPSPGATPPLPAPGHADRLTSGPGRRSDALFIGGSVRGAIEQLGPDADVRLFDASGKHRTVGDGEGWKICSARQTPEQLIVFGAVMRNENC